MILGGCDERECGELQTTARCINQCGHSDGDSNGKVKAKEAGSRRVLSLIFSPAFARYSVLLPSRSRS